MNRDYLDCCVDTRLPLGPGNAHAVRLYNMHDCMVDFARLSCSVKEADTSCCVTQLGCSLWLTGLAGKNIHWIGIP